MPKSVTEKKPKGRRAPGTSLEAIENRMIALSYKEAEQLILNHKASQQVLLHFMKMGSTKEKLEKERLISENKLLRAKTEAIQDVKKMEELYNGAIKAMKSYSGQGDGSEIGENDES